MMQATGSTVNDFSWLNNCCRLSENICGCRSSRPTTSSFKSNWLWKVVRLRLLPFLFVTTCLRWNTPGAMQLGVALQGSSNRCCFHLLLFELSRWYNQVNFYLHVAQSGIQEDLKLPLTFRDTVPTLSVHFKRRFNEEMKSYTKPTVTSPNF